LPQSADTLAVVVVVTALIGELPLTLWLLVKGVDVERWRQRALAWLSMVSGACPVAVMKCAQWRPADLPDGGQKNCPESEF